MHIRKNLESYRMKLPRIWSQAKCACGGPDKLSHNLPQIRCSAKRGKCQTTDGNRWRSQFSPLRLGFVTKRKYAGWEEVRWPLTCFLHKAEEQDGRSFQHRVDAK